MNENINDNENIENDGYLKEEQQNYLNDDIEIKDNNHFDLNNQPQLTNEN